LKKPENTEKTEKIKKRLEEKLVVRVYPALFVASIC